MTYALRQSAEVARAVLRRLGRCEMGLPALVRRLVGVAWTGWRRGAAWAVCVGTVLALGAIRTGTDVELTFASLALLPVLFIAWIDGKRNGVLMAFLATAMWAAADIASERQFSASWIPWANAATRLMIYSIVALLAAQVRLQLDRERECANEDALTGLQNRRGFLAAGAGEVERATRYGFPLSVLFLDLDDFKQINDTRGHASGDAALRATARALGALRSSDRVARMGGDEFAILLPEIGYEAALEAGRKIALAVNRALRDFPPVKASIGVAWFARSDRPFPEMLKQADKLMYQAKAGGKNALRSQRFEARTVPQA